MESVEYKALAYLLSKLRDELGEEFFLDSLLTYDDLIDYSVSMAEYMVENKIKETKPTILPDYIDD